MPGREGASAKENAKREQEGGSRMKAEPGACLEEDVDLKPGTS